MMQSSCILSDRLPINEEHKLIKIHLIVEKFYITVEHIFILFYNLSNIN